MKINGIIPLPDNCSLEWTANFIKVRVSLNIEKELVKFLPKNKICKGNKFWVYWVAKEIPLQFCTPKNIEDTYFNLQQKAMINLRSYKKMMLDAQIRKIKTRQVKLNF